MRTVPLLMSTNHFSTQHFIKIIYSKHSEIQLTAMYSLRSVRCTHSMEAAGKAVIHIKLNTHIILIIL